MQGRQGADDARACQRHAHRFVFSFGDVRMRQQMPFRGHSGFTLIEMMVALFVAAILLVIAIPGFKHSLLSYRLTTQANEVVASLSAARMQAIKINARVQVCGSTASTNGSDALGTACATSAGASWYLVNGTATQMQAAIEGLNRLPLQINGDFTAIRYDGTGIGHAVGSSAPFGSTSSDNAVVDLCTSSMDTDNHRIVRLTAGSIINVETTSGECG